MERTIWAKTVGVAETLAIVAASVAVVLSVIVGHIADGKAARPARATPVAEDVRQRRWSIALDDAATIKSPGARIAVIEFSDFQCPFCSRHARDTFPRIQRDLIKRGRVHYSFKHFPLGEIHPLATDAAIHAICAGKQARFWEMHDRLFRDVTPLSRQVFSSAANELNLDIPRFDTCLTTASDDISKDKTDAQRLGVTSTPTFFIGKITDGGLVSIVFRLSGAVPYETFATTITQLGVERDE